MAIAVDGWWGGDTILALKQHYMTYFFDDHVHTQYQPNLDANTALVQPYWEGTYNPQNDALVALIQEKVGVPVDGIIGAQTIRALQAKMGTYVDGVLTGPSPCVMELQRRINSGRFLD